jgi:hypothetical protein
MIQPNTQRIKLLSIVALLMVAGCARTTQSDKPEDPAVAAADANTVQQPSEEPEKTPAVTDEVVPEQPVVVAIDPVVEQWSDSLKKYFDASEFATINRAVNQYHAISSATDLANFYQAMLRDSIQPLVERHFQNGCRHADYGSFADDDWDWVGEMLPFIGTKVSCHHLPDGSVNCVHLAPISLLPLRDIASDTKEPEDDLFFDALIAIHTGTEPGQPVGFEVFDGQDNYHTRQTVGCTECTIGMLGDGHRSELISKMSQAARARKLFNKAFAYDLSHLLGSLQQDTYHYSKAAILNELDEIINTGTTTKLLTKKELASLHEVHLWVQAKETGFECTTGDCQGGAASFE